MKPNSVKRLLGEGKLPVGHMVFEFGTRGMAQLLERAGVDFVVVDTEHTGFTSADVADLMAWFSATNIAPFVRIPQIEYHFIARTLDAGALGIMAPNVSSAAEARALVDAVKYAPLGRRGVFLGGANTQFQTADPAEFMEYANQNTTVICQIESQAGLQQVEAIATTPGVDVLWVGHFDLSHAMGISGQFQHPRMIDALKLVADTARTHGLAAAIQPRDLQQAQQWLELGFNMLSYSGDMFVYLDALSDAVTRLRELGQQ